ncbi:MAG: GAF domain-containing protein [Chloroflexi bacterium]|nr:GAF domain-containing protein [Chloroflexota bacterium]
MPLSTSTQTVTSTLDLDEVVRLTIGYVHSSWNIEAASLWWLDEAKDILRVLANVGTPLEILNRVEVPLGEGFVGHVAQTGRWVYTNDAPSHPLHYRDVDFRTGFKTQSLLCVPLLFGGKVVGAMQLLNKQNSDFDDQDVEKALSLAAAVATAVSNALRFGEIAAEKDGASIE